MIKIFDWCVQFMMIVAPKLGLTYKEFNVWLFVIIHPLLTLFLLITSSYYCLKYYRLKKKTNITY
jgi:hypothetical protein